MIGSMKRFIFMLGILAATVLGCSKDPEFNHPNSESVSTGTPISRPANQETRRVLIVMSCGFNSLSFDLKEDIDDMMKAKLPGLNRDDDVLLIYGQHVSSTYDNPSNPVLIQAYSKEGKAVRDTLKVWNDVTVSTSSDNAKEVLTYVRNHFPAKEYHLLFSSHATGWLPAGYYTFDTSGNSYTENSAMSMPLDYWSEGPFTHEERGLAPGEPRTKTLGETRIGTKGNYQVYEMDLRKFAKSIPMHLSSILFDCCLMGCVEVAYELKDVCDRIVFSPAEVLSDGFNYKVLFEHLFDSSTNVQSVAEDYFEQYRNRTGVNQSATITMVDCRHMNELAAVCKDIFEAHRDKIRMLKGSGIQQFHRYDFNCFYDLRDIIVKAGASAEELARLDSALEKCVPYKAATPAFMYGYNGFKINTYCGLSSYLPAEGDGRTKAAYGPLAWNTVTEFVK